MTRRGTPNAVVNKWKPIQESSTKENILIETGGNSKALKSIEAFEARKKILMEKKQQEDAVKLRDKMEKDKAREERMKQRRSLYEAPVSSSNITSLKIDPKGNTVTTAASQSQIESSLNSISMQRSHSVVNAAAVFDKIDAKAREATDIINGRKSSSGSVSNRYNSAVFRGNGSKLSNNRYSNFSSSSNSFDNDSNNNQNSTINNEAASFRNSISRNREGSSSSYKSKFQMFEKHSSSNNNDSFSGLKSTTTSGYRSSLAVSPKAGSSDRTSPFKMDIDKSRFSSGKSLQSGKSVNTTNSSHSISEDPSKENIAPKPRSRNFLNNSDNNDSIKTSVFINTETKNTASLGLPSNKPLPISPAAPLQSTQQATLPAKEPIKLIENKICQNQNKNADQDLQDDEVFDQKPIEITNLSLNSPKITAVESKFSTSTDTPKSIAREEEVEEKFDLDEFQLKEFDELGLSETARRAILSRASEAE